MDIVQVGFPKRYGKFKHQAICIFSYEGWNIIIHPDFLLHLANSNYNYQLYQILFEGYGFCFTLLDGCGTPKTYSSGMKYNAPLFSASLEFDNWRGPYIGKNKFITEYQRKGFMKLRNILKSFNNLGAFVDIIKHELKHLEHVPHNITYCYGISIGSKVNLNPVDGKTPYNVFKKRWLLSKYGLDQPISNEKIFYDKLLPKINSLNQLWKGSSKSAANRNDSHIYQIVKKKQKEEYNLKIKEINLKRKEIVKKYFIAFKKYINENRDQIDDNLISIKEKIIEKLEINNEIDINKELSLIFENNNQVFLKIL